MITIKDYLWGVHPEQLIAIYKEFYGLDISIEKEKKDDRK